MIDIKKEKIDITYNEDIFCFACLLVLSSQYFISEIEFFELLKHYYFNCFEVMTS